MTSNVHAVFQLIESNPDEYGFIEAALELDISPVEALEMIGAFGHEDVFAYLETRTILDEDA